eukprot:353822-Chlamydomonas_euryale.AAC.2
MYTEHITILSVHCGRCTRPKRAPAAHRRPYGWAHGHECMGAWARRRMSAWLHGRFGAWAHRRPDGWAHGCTCAWVHGHIDA